MGEELLLKTESGSDSKLRVRLITAVTLLILTSACSINSESSENASYQVGLSEEFSPAMLEFLVTYSMPMYSTVHKLNENGFTYARFNVENNRERIDYFITPKEDIAAHFNPLIEAELVRLELRMSL